MMIFSAPEMGMKLLNYNIADAMHAAKFTAAAIAPAAMLRQAHISHDHDDKAIFAADPISRLTKRHKRG
jgi:hypothetical protein